MAAVVVVVAVKTAAVEAPPAQMAVLEVEAVVVADAPVEEGEEVEVDVAVDVAEVAAVVVVGVAVEALVAEVPVEVEEEVEVAEAAETSEEPSTTAARLLILDSMQPSTSKSLLRVFSSSSNSLNSPRLKLKLDRSTITELGPKCREVGQVVLEEQAVEVVAEVLPAEGRPSHSRPALVVSPRTPAMPARPLVATRAPDKKVLLPATIYYHCRQHFSILNWQFGSILKLLHKLRQLAAIFTRIKFLFEIISGEF